ncbi:hypothetical protein Tco_1537164, partial [Tanacetum coccineum]
MGRMGSFCIRTPSNDLPWLQDLASLLFSALGTLRTSLDQNLASIDGLERRCEGGS